MAIARSRSNLRPGRSPATAYIRSIANAVRTWAYFKLRAPFVARRGMVRIPWSVSIWSPSRHVVLGDRVQFGPHCVIQCDADIGNDVLIAERVALIGRDDHRIDVVGSAIWDSPRGDQLKVVLEDDTWIGFGAIVLSGVKVGRGSVVAAGAVVTRDVPPYCVVAGVPARVIRSRFSPQEIAQHEEMVGASKQAEKK